MINRKNIKLSLYLSNGSIDEYMKKNKQMGISREDSLEELNLLVKEVEEILATNAEFMKKIAQIRNTFYKIIRYEKTADSWYIRFIYKKFNMGDGKTT